MSGIQDRPAQPARGEALPVELPGHRQPRLAPLCACFSFGPHALAALLRFIGASPIVRRPHSIRYAKQPQRSNIRFRSIAGARDFDIVILPPDTGFLFSQGYNVRVNNKFNKGRNLVPHL
jgi:hypothetical protein